MATSSRHTHVTTVPLYQLPNPMPNFWQRASTARKAAYVAGGVAATALTIYVVRKIAAPKPFVSISPQCNDFALGTREQVDAALVPLVRYAGADGDVVDPFAVATEFLHRYASDCSAYPHPARNPGEAALYVAAFVEVMRVMEAERLLSLEQRGYFTEMVGVWGRSQGLTADQLPTVPIPSPGMML